jgi:FO synthase
MAGSQNGSYKTISQMSAMAGPLGRPIKQRTTLYEKPSAERQAAAAVSDGVCTSVRGGLTRLPLVSR